MMTARSSLDYRRAEKEYCFGHQTRKTKQVFGFLDL